MLSRSLLRSTTTRSNVILSSTPRFTFHRSPLSPLSVLQLSHSQRIPQSRLPLLQLPRHYSSLPPTPPTTTSTSTPSPSPTLPKHENIYTIPNALTLARILACPAIGYYIVKGELGIATSLLFVAGVSDLVRSSSSSQRSRSFQLG